MTNTPKIRMLALHAQDCYLNLCRHTDLCPSCKPFTTNPAEMHYCETGASLMSEYLIACRQLIMPAAY